LERLVRKSLYIYSNTSKFNNLSTIVIVK